MTPFRMKLVGLAAVAVLSACGGASSGSAAGADASLPAFDGGPGTLWLHLVGDVVVGLDTHDGHEVKRIERIGAYEGGDGTLALGGGKLWFQGNNAVRGVDLASGVAADIPGSTARYPASGGGAVWWAEEGTLTNPRPIFRYDVAAQTTSNTNAAGIPEGTAGLIAAGAEGCFSLYMVLADSSRGVAHVKPDGSALVSIPLPGAKNLLLGASVITGNGRGYAVTETMTQTTRPLFAIDAATDTIVAQLRVAHRLARLGVLRLEQQRQQVHRRRRLRAALGDEGQDAPVQERVGRLEAQVSGRRHPQRQPARQEDAREEALHLREGRLEGPRVAQRLREHRPHDDVARHVHHEAARGDGLARLQRVERLARHLPHRVHPLGPMGAAEGRLHGAALGEPQRWIRQRQPVSQQRANRVQRGAAAPRLELLLQHLLQRLGLAQHGEGDGPYAHAEVGAHAAGGREEEGGGVARQRAGVGQRQRLIHHGQGHGGGQATPAQDHGRCRGLG